MALQDDCGVNEQPLPGPGMSPAFKSQFHRRLPMVGAIRLRAKGVEGRTVADHSGLSMLCSCSRKRRADGVGRSPRMALCSVRRFDAQDYQPLRSI